VIRTLPISKRPGTTTPARARTPAPAGLSQNFRTELFYSENPAPLWHNCGRSEATIDDSPKEFAREFRSAVLKRRVGQIALAVVLAEACIRFLNSLIWFLLVPFIASLLQGHTESVLFRDKLVFPWEQLFGSLLEFILAIVFVFYANRWIQGSLAKPRVPEEAEASEPPRQKQKEGQV
jgi:large-conductance mechanosensitive channel